MKTITAFYLVDCPYCKQANRALAELIKENPDYAKVEINWIEENEHPEIIAKYDYQSVPCMWIEDKKIYEAHLFERYNECKQNIKDVLDLALES